MDDVKPDTIFQVSCGFMASKLLFVANEVRLFEQLAEAPATLDELTQRIGAPGRTMRILADALVALGFLQNHNGRYHHSAPALAFLSGRGNEDFAATFALLRPAELCHVDEPRASRSSDAFTH